MNRTKQQGLSLVEILITLALLAIGVVGLLSLQGTTTKAVATSKERAEAILIGTQKMEQLRDYQTVPTTTGLTAYDDIATGTSTVNSNSTAYTLNWTVTDNDHSKSVNLTVSWSSRDGENESVNLTSIISEQEPRFVGYMMNVPVTGFSLP